MKVRCRACTYVRNSPIHSLGLFAAEAYDAQQMVIEYTGQPPLFIMSFVCMFSGRKIVNHMYVARHFVGVVVRQQVADKREHEYLQRGVACYLFALDEHQIIDSSMKGNSARFINHCCDVRSKSCHVCSFAFVYAGETLTTYFRVVFGFGAWRADTTQPNCTARVMTLDGAKRIIFITLREIAPGEEFTYDYKFAPDNDPTKRNTIPCNCGAVTCRKWLN